MQRFILGLLLFVVLAAAGVYLWRSREQSRGRTTASVEQRGTGASESAAPVAENPPSEGPRVDSQPDTRSLPEAPGGGAAAAASDTTPPVDPSVPGGAQPNLSKAVGGIGGPAAALREVGPFDRQIGLPIANLKSSDVRDTFNDSRGEGSRKHEATDILSPKGTPVIAVDTGIVKKLFTSKPGGLTVYQFDSLEKYVYYYAHLDRYAEGLREGLLLKRGDKVGYVGVTGNSDPNVPHLHFAILQLGPEKKWYEDTIPINPFPILMKQFRSR